MNDRDRDPEMRKLLAALDPERVEPGYWGRFHRWVMRSAVAELARRRRREATVSEVMLGWWRTVVPIAAVAAAAAGFYLARDLASPMVEPAIAGAEASMDDLLREGVEAPVMPSFETADPTGGIVVVNEIY